MDLRRVDLSRRRFLRGVGGATLGLPILDVWGRRAHAAVGKPVVGAFVVNMNGVQQAGFGSEPESFWPKALGPLTKAGLAAQTDRATAELADHAERLLMIRGVKLPFQDSGCSHSGAGNQLLTAQRPSEMPNKNKSLATGESLDTYVGRSLGVEPLALYAGPKAGYINDHIAFRGSKDVRVGENNPFLAYTRMIGAGGGAAASPELVQKIASRRLSVNDLVRDELKQVLGRPDLSMADRGRIQMHLEAVREIEIKLVRELSPADVSAMKAMTGNFKSGAVRLQIERMQFDLMAFALASGYTQVAFLQIGDGTDAIEHEIDGVKLSRFHLISHRASSDSSVNDGSMPDAAAHHHKIDRLVLRQWKYFLDKLQSHSTPDGSLLDIGYSMWANHVGTGNHNFHNIPYLVAGKARGFWKTGQYFSTTGAISSSASGNQTNNKLLNQFINAFGIRKQDGALVDDFGDTTLAKGVLAGVSAAT